MSTDELTGIVLEVLGQIAPEADMDELSDDIPLRDQLDIDSMDYLNFLIGLNQRTGVEIAERDYAELTTLRGCVEYLRARLPG